MALSDSFIQFGLCQVTVSNATTGIPYFTSLLAKSASFESSLTLETQTGGCFTYPVGAEQASREATLSVSFADLRPQMFDALDGSESVVNAAEASGAVTTLTNLFGTTVQDATTGIASVGVKSGEEANVKFCGYLVEAATATTVNVYAYFAQNFRRGEDIEYTDDTLKIASGLTVPGTGGTVEIVDDTTGNSTGLELTGGSGTVAFTPGDTAFFNSRPQNTDSWQVEFGKSGETVPEVLVTVTGQVLASGAMVQLELYRAVASGLPHPFEEKAFAEREVEFTVLQNFERNAVGRYAYVTPTPE